MGQLNAANLSQLGRDVDDGARSRVQHGSDCATAAKETTSQMHGDHPVKIFDLHFGQRRLGYDACIVHSQGDTAPCLLAHFIGAIDIPRIRHIT